MIDVAQWFVGYLSLYFHNGHGIVDVKFSVLLIDCILFEEVHHLILNDLLEVRTGRFES